MKNRQHEVVYGIHTVEALLTYFPGNVQSILLTERKDNSSLAKLQALMKKCHIQKRFVDKVEIQRVAGTSQHQGVVAIYDRIPLLAEKEIGNIIAKMAGQPLILILDSIQDPHNLGACLRVADGAGVDLVIMPKRGACDITSVVHKVASGATFSVPYMQVTNLGRIIQKLQEQGVWVIGTEAEAKNSIYQQDWQMPTALVMGAEGSGMRKLTRDYCDTCVSIPMQGGVPSLNISVASAVCLYEIQRARLMK